MENSSRRTKLIKTRLCLCRFLKETKQVKRHLHTRIVEEKQP